MAQSTKSLGLKFADSEDIGIGQTLTASLHNLSTYARALLRRSRQ